MVKVKVITTFMSGNKNKKQQEVINTHLAKAIKGA